MASNKGPNIGYVRSEVKRELHKWQLVDDAVQGEQAIKEKGEEYLPKPEVHTDRAINEKLYKKYKTRAVFFPVTGRTLAGLSGQVFSKPVAIQAPASLELLIKDVDGSGTSLEQQSKETLASVIKKGRAGLLSDFPKVEPGSIVTRADVESGSIRSRVIFYQPEQIINWREMTTGGKTKLSLLVLYENKIVEDDGFEIKTEPRWRVYRLSDEFGGVSVALWKRTERSNNSFSEESKEYEIDEPEVPVIGSDQMPLQSIPFSFVGAENNDVSVDESPLYPLAQLNIAHYRNSADYEQSAFNVGQPTAIFSGLTDDWVEKHINGKVTLGSVTPVSLPQNASAMLLQASPNSMAKDGMDHKEDQMKAIGAKLIEPGTVQRTATEAEIEETSEASVLSSIAKNVSAAYEMALYYCSLFIEPVSMDDIEVSLNSEFQISGLNAQERQEVLGAWQSGLLAWSEARDVYRRKGIATIEDDAARQIIQSEGVSGFDQIVQNTNEEGV